MRTEPWWTCTCGKKIIRVGKGGISKAWKDHEQTCRLKDGEHERDAEKQRRFPDMYIPIAMRIEQHLQGKK